VWCPVSRTGSRPLIPLNGSLQPSVHRKNVMDHHILSGPGSSGSPCVVEIVPYCSPINSWLELHYAYLPLCAFCCVHFSQGCVYLSCKCSTRFVRSPGCHICPFKHIDAYILECLWYRLNVWGIVFRCMPVLYTKPRHGQGILPFPLVP
jgi:hypothetical protein